MPLTCFAVIKPASKPPLELEVAKGICLYSYSSHGRRSLHKSDFVWHTKCGPENKTLCRNLKHCVDLHTSTQFFHELENLNFLKKEAFWYIVICLKMEENIKRIRKDWDEIRPKRIFSGNGNGLKNLIFFPPSIDAYGSSTFLCNRTRTHEQVVDLMAQSQISCDASAMGKTREIWTKSWDRSHDFAPVGGALRTPAACRRFFQASPHPSRSPTLNLKL